MGAAASRLLTLLLLAACLGRTRQFSFQHALRLRGGQKMAPAADTFTLQQLALELADARAHIQKVTGLDDDMVCRMILTTRMANLPLARCTAGPSSVPGAGQGLFVSRDIAEGELITLYPSDCVIIWEDAEHSLDGNVQLFFGRHIPDTQRDAARAVLELKGYHVPTTETRSICADPALVDDAAYLGHMANDAVACESAEFQESYERDSMARANAEIIPFDVAEVDEAGNNLVLHYALRALKPMQAGEEVFLHYGFDYWQLNA